MKCKLCNTDVREGEAIKFLGHYLHPPCYMTVERRVVTFLNVLLLPEPDFQEWLGVDEPIHLPCMECGSDLEEIRPGKWQCPECE